MRKINIQRVKQNLSQLMAEAVRGEPFVITVNGVPKVQVVALEPVFEKEKIPAAKTERSE
jgi:prevent-host-death family protein